ncbi:methionine ABC transporter permease [Konateibacter massiliensis]|uniref:methionine ABC transporter permease n=1 Tax=Konateibacter massiliensis TaxID=2002841 RepID=UPI000C14C9BC|nr:methionine ABC transporter permease [Konateibacter massiliensis]
MEINQLVLLMLTGAKESLYMTLVATAFSYFIGIPVGVLLFITDKNGIWENKILNTVLGIIVNLTRSIPFIILLVAMLPVTRFIVGTSIGSTATIVPLVSAATPFVARMVESSLKEVDGGIIEAALAMGSSTFQIIWKVLLPEAKPSLMVGCTIAITTILGYSAMAGFVGGGGLGAIAVNYGYYRYQTDIMLITVVLLVIIVQIFQEIGMRFANRTDKRIKNS